LARVVLPTGGAIEYDMTPGTGVVTDTNNESTGTEIYRRLAERRTYPDGSTLEGRTVYSEYNDTSTSYVEVKNYAGSTLLGGSRHYFIGGTARNNIIQMLDGVGFPLETYPPWDRGKEAATEQYATDGTNLTTRLRLSATSWQANGTMGGLSVNPVAAATMTTLTDVSPNLVTKSTSVNPGTGALGFDQYNNPTDTWEYDYGSGAAPAYAVRHTHIDYLTTNPVNSIDYTSQSGAHVRNLPRAQQAYSVNPQNGAETLVAQSETRYDEYSLTNYGSVTGWSDPGTAARGLATTSRRWVDTSNTWLESHASYDQVGNAVSATDARGITSYVSYADSYTDGARGTYALPTSTTSAVPDPSNQHGANTPLTSSTVYDYYTGHVTSTTDANGQTTSAQYEGGTYQLDRLIQVSRPDGGQTTYTYVDQHVCGPYVETKTLIDSSGRWTDAWQFSDGLGRPYLSESYDGQDANNPYLRVDTRYDSLGRVSQVSNPYRTSGCTAATNPSGRWTTSSYDALGRPVSVVTPDGATVSTSYLGNHVTVTDQANKVRSSVSDALGRLTQVVEDPAGVAYATNYAYDTLGNLRQVVQDQPANAQYPQGVQQRRYFMYDSLSRLIRAKNPEQIGSISVDADFPALTDSTSGVSNSDWSMGYIYDADGNLAKRKDARNIVATYTYDNLNRNTTVDYSNTTSNPDIDRHYDNPTAGSYGRGRYYYDFYYKDDGTIDHQAIDAYDVMGRALTHRQVFYSGGQWYHYPVNRVYDLAGNVKQQTYPSDHTVSYNYDAAGRLADNGGYPAFSGNLGDGSQRTYAGGLSYDEASRLQAALQRAGSALRCAPLDAVASG
jgi:YD repeat-containing protein